MKYGAVSQEIGNRYMSIDWYSVGLQADVIITLLTKRKGRLKGENFQKARQKLKNDILRPADIHRLDDAARALRDKHGVLVWSPLPKNGNVMGQIVVDEDKLKEWLVPLARTYRHPAHQVDPRLKSQIKTLMFNFPIEDELMAIA